MWQERILLGFIKPVNFIHKQNSAHAEPPILLSQLHDLHHICLAVEDLDTTLFQLAERDVPSLADPMEVPEIGQRIGFITDNTGNIIELTEPGT